MRSIRNHLFKGYFSIGLQNIQKDNNIQKSDSHFHLEFRIQNILKDEKSTTKTNNKIRLGIRVNGQLIFQRNRLLCLLTKIRLSIN